MTTTAPTEIPVSALRVGDRIRSFDGKTEATVTSIQPAALAYRVGVRADDGRAADLTFNAFDRVGRVAKAPEEPAISTTSSGMHKAIVTVGDTPVRVLWEDQQVVCCAGRRPLNIADGTHVPVWHSNEAESMLDELHPEVTQCDGCGTLHAAKISVRRLPQDALA